MKKNIVFLLVAVIVLVLGVGFVEAVCPASTPNINPCAKIKNLEEWTKCKRDADGSCSGRADELNCCSAAIAKCNQAALTKGVQALSGVGIAPFMTCGEANICIGKMKDPVKMAQAVANAVPGQTCVSAEKAASLAQANTGSNPFKGASLGEYASLISAGAAVAQAAVAYLNYQETARNNQFQRDDTLYNRRKAEQKEQEEKKGGECDPRTGIGYNCATDPPATSGSGNSVALASATNFCTGNICQDTSQVPSGTKFTFGSIHMTFTNRDYYGLLEGPNNGIRYNNGIVYFDSTGTTLFSIKAPYSFVEHENGNQIILGTGSTYYYGPTRDYTTNSRMINPQTGTIVATTLYRDGNVFSDSNAVTGAAVTRSTFESTGPSTGVSYNHYVLPLHENAIDIGDVGNGFQVQAKGYLNLELLAENGQFPIAFRGVAKGDTLITFSKNVVLHSNYLVQDGIYEYIIVPEESSTKVFTENQKVIQDTAGLPNDLSSRQRNMVYSS